MFRAKSVLLAVPVALAAAMMAGTAIAQSPVTTRAEGGPAGVETSPEAAARLVRIDAVVVDRQGRPVLNLDASDFEVIENGVAQKIDAVELRAAAGGAAAAAVPVESDADVARAVREPDTRVIGLVLDEFHVGSGEPSRRAREALTRFLDEQVRPGDLLAVLKPLDTVTSIRFARDRDVVRRAIESFDGRKGDFAPRTEFEQKYMGRAPEAVRAGRGQIVMAALRAMMMKLGDLEAGRSALVLVTEGFGRAPSRAREGRVPDVQGLVRAASRFNVAVYTLNPALATTGGTPNLAAHAENLLDRLAEDTGGEAVIEGGDLLGALGRMARDLDAYYVVSYTSSHPGDGRFYEVQVRTRRRDAQVRSRSGYWAPLRTELLRDRGERTLVPVRALRRSPLIQTWLGLTMQPDGTGEVTLTWEPAADAPRGAPAPALVSMKIGRPDGTVLFGGEVAAPRSPSRAGRPDAAVFAAAGGRIQVDLVVFGADGAQIDTASQDLDLPDVSRSDPVVLPPRILAASSAREFRELLADQAAAPVPARSFRRTERLLIRVPVHSTSGAPIEVTARLMNRSGQVLHELDRPDASDTHGVPAFDLPLAPFAPGEYSIELVATSPAGSAREIVRFRLTG